MATDTLSPEHRQALEQHSCISPEVIAARGYQTIASKKELDELGFAAAQRRVPGLLIPLFAPDGTAAGHQLRPDSPRADSHGKVVKYETPKGAGWGPRPWQWPCST